MSTSRWQHALNLLRAIRNAAHGSRKVRAQKAVDAAKKIPVAPKPPAAPKATVLHYPAIIAARTQSANGPQHGVGECLMAVQECYGIRPRDPSAAAAWAAAKVKHRTSDPNAIPRGYPVFWTGGGSGFGHIAIATGNGMCWSTDIKRTGFFDLVPIDLIRTAWPGHTLVGWTEDLEGVTVVAKTR